MDNLYIHRINSRSSLQVSIEAGVTTVQVQSVSDPAKSDALRSSSTHHSSHRFTSGSWQSAPIFQQLGSETVAVTIVADQVYHVHYQNGHLHISGDANAATSSVATSSSATSSSATSSSATSSSKTTSVTASSVTYSAHSTHQ